jgi:hypothetical protein
LILKASSYRLERANHPAANRDQLRPLSSRPHAYARMASPSCPCCRVAAGDAGGGHGSGGRSGADLSLMWAIDDRPEFVQELRFPERGESADRLTVAAEHRNHAQHLPPDRPADTATTRKLCFTYDRTRYVGLIGSRRKIR